MSKIKNLTNLFNFVLGPDVNKIKFLESAPKLGLNFGRCFSVTASNPMRFVQYKCKNSDCQKLGVQLSQDSDIIEISTIHPSIPNNLVDFLQGNNLMDIAKRVVGKGESVVSLEDVNILPPITKPDKIVCVGLNYKSHCQEQKQPFPSEPFFFSKFPSTIIGPSDDIKHPPNTKALDWEIELGVVMGKTCRNVLEHEVNDYIFGYTVAQDISARDWQKKTKNNGQWLFAKSMDTFCPLGPAVVAKEFISNPQDLQMTCRVNGMKKQHESTSDMIHKIEPIVSFLSHCITLLPGDVILTGTPAGVGLFASPREFLKIGDVIESEISGIGKLVNHIIQ